MIAGVGVLLAINSLSLLLHCFFKISLHGTVAEVGVSLSTHYMGQ